MERHDASQRRLIWPPEPGFFRLRLVKRGWPVPCQIILRDGPLWQAERDGVLAAPHPDPAIAEYVADIWTGGSKVDEFEYRWLIALKAHCLAHEPDHPAVNPRRPIDHRLLAPLIPRTPLR